MACFICLKIPGVFTLEKQTESLFDVQQGFLAHSDVSALVATSGLPLRKVTTSPHESCSPLWAYFYSPLHFEELLFDEEMVWKVRTAPMPSLVMDLAGRGWPGIWCSQCCRSVPLSVIFLEFLFSSVLCFKVSFLLRWRDISVIQNGLLNYCSFSCNTKKMTNCMTCLGNSLFKMAFRSCCA